MARIGPRASRWTAMVAVVGVVASSACVPAADGNAALTTASAPPAPVSVTHEIDLGDGRMLFLTCAGAGPTVVLESGYHESSDTWKITADESDRSVFDRLASRFRVCAYDRAGTLLLLGDAPVLTDRTTPVPMPRSATDIVADLHKAFGASGEQGPFLLTAHSMGGLLARLYAQTYPQDVAGVVFVDAFPVEIPALLGDKWAAYEAVLNSTGGGELGAGYERIDIEAAIAAIAGSGPFPDIPIAVVSKELPFAGLPETTIGFTAGDLESAWVAGQPALVALRPGTPHLIATGSDHYVHIRQPDLVAAMVDVVAGRTVH